MLFRRYPGSRRGARTLYLPQASPPAPPPAATFPPAGAVWWYDRTLLPDAAIGSWNAKAAQNSGGAASEIDLRPHGMPGKARLKNAATQPRVVASGTHKGAVRVMRRSHPPFTDPTGGPDDTDDTENLNAAHALLQACKDASGLTQWSIPYGQLVEVGFRFMVPAPSDSDLAAFQGSAAGLLIIFELTTSSNRTTEGWALVLGQTSYYTQRIVLRSGYSAGGLVAGTLHGKNGYQWHYYPGQSGGDSVDNLPNLQAAPWAANQWYDVKIVCVVDKNGAAWPAGHRGWADLYIDDMTTPYVSARRIQSGKSDDTATETVSWGQYSSYGLDGQRRCVYFDRMYIKLGATGYPSAPS